MPQLKFNESFFKATPHLSDTDVSILTEKEAEAVKDKALIQIDADAYLNIWATSPHRWQAFSDHLENTGQLDPIIVDEQGQVLDGFVTWFALIQKKVAAKEIFTKVIKHLKTDADKITWIRSRKLARGNLTESQRMELVKAEIKAHPERGNNFQAILLGVDHKTVAKYRQELEDLGTKNGGIKWYTLLVNAKGRKDKNPGMKPLSESRGKLTESIENAFTEAKKYQEMKHKGMTIPEIADKEGKSETEVMDTVGILDLNKEKQEQIKQGKLDPKKALKAQDRLMGQAMHELPNHTLLPRHIPPHSELFLRSLLTINDFCKYLAEMDLSEYLPELKESIIQMASDFAKDYARVEKALEEQRKNWQAKEEKKELQNACDEKSKKEADAKKGKQNVKKEKAKGKVRNKVKLVLLPDTELSPSDDQKKAAK